MTRRAMSMRRACAAVGFSALTLVAGCSGGDSIQGPGKDVDDIFWELRLDHTAVTMAVGETLQLTATPLTADGRAIANLPRPHYESVDDSVVTIDSLGRLTAKRPGYMIFVIARLTSVEDGVTNVDTVFVNINDVGTPVRSFTIQQPDSLNVAVDWWTDIMVNITDNANNSVPGVLLNFRSSHPLRAKVDPVWGSMQPKNVGPVTIYAEATIYGTKYSDSIKYNVTYPLWTTVTISNTDATVATSPSFFAMPIVQIQKGGSVDWDNRSTHAVDVTFDDPSKIDGGNIEEVPAGSGVGRTFNTPGTYHYRSTRYGSTGRVIVHP